jgi:homoserine dehydrogenase
LKPAKVGICGLGTVGSGAFNILKRNASEIARRAGRDIEVVQVGARRDNPACNLNGVNVARDIFDVVKNPDVDIVVELIGGYDVARELVMKAIENGKHVVTANKALIAVHGNEIFEAAQKKGVIVAFEAAVAGGIPIIKTIREGLSANRIDWLAGIINGTSNFILTAMREQKQDFAVALKEAQALGYAEADPTFDVEGVDAAHKLTILASIAFGIPLQFKSVYTEGITKITADDISFAEELGYRIKHLGIARRTAKGIELRVHPTFVPEEKLIASVNGVMNAVLIQGDAVGQNLSYGRGAGAEPTGSAVVADLVDVVRSMTSDPENRVPHLAFQPNALSNIPVLPVDEIETAYYLRIQAVEKVGVLAQIAQTLSKNGISIEAIVQKEVREGEKLVPIIMLTQRIQEKHMNAAIAEIEGLGDVVGKVARIRVEHLDK